MKDLYKGQEGALRLIADLAYDYDNAKTEDQLKELIDEMRNISIKALEIKEKWEIDIIG